MKILRILPGMDMGGIERGVYDFSLKALEFGHDIVIAAGGGRFMERLKETGVKWYEVPMDKKTPVVYFSSIEKLKRVIRRENPDIIHVQSRFPCWIAVQVMKSFPSIPWITSIHSFNKQRFYSCSEGKGKRVIAVSKALKKHAVDYLMIPEEKISVVYNGIGDDFLNIDEKRNDVPCIGMISRFSFYKGHYVFLRAFKSLVDQGVRANAIIIGSGSSSYKRKLNEWISKNGLENSAGVYSMDGTEALSKIDILAVPSLVPEGFGRTVVEAQMSGTPVVGTNIGAIPELIEDGNTGFLVEPGNYRQLSEKIKYFLDNPEVTENIATNAKKSALANFTVSVMVEKTLDVYRKALS